MFGGADISPQGVCCSQLGVIFSLLGFRVIGCSSSYHVLPDSAYANKVQWLNAALDFIKRRRYHHEIHCLDQLFDIEIQDGLLGVATIREEYCVNYRITSSLRGRHSYSHQRNNAIANYSLLQQNAFVIVPFVVQDFGI